MAIPCVLIDGGIKEGVPTPDRFMAGEGYMSRQTHRRPGWLYIHNLSPWHNKRGDYTADAKTAGSVCLLLQVALPCLLYATGSALPTSRLVLRGGTNADMAPPVDFLTAVLNPILALNLGIRLTVNVVKRGYFPKGGGEIDARVEGLGPGSTLKPISLTDRGQVVGLGCRSFVADGERCSSFGPVSLAAAYPSVSPRVEVLKEPAHSATGNGSGVMLTAKTTTQCILSGSALGKRGVSPEEVGLNAAKDLCQNLEYGGCVDEYTQDQLILFMALAKGTSCIRTGPITLHTESVIYIVEKMIPQLKFDIQKDTDGTFLISCEGIGHCAPPP